MTLRDSFFIFLLLLGLTASAAVPAEVRGCVTDADTGLPIAGVVVRGIKSSGKPAGFTSTDAAGRFALKVNEGVDSVSFRRMGYESVRLPIASDFSKVPLFTKTTLLNEVIVKAPDIYAKGDTLVFNVDRYSRPDDNAIIDIIKRLPGVKVEDDGTIKYQGKPISKFYLDGNDFLGGRYGLATENISYKDVKSVEVMENHQPVKALEGIEFPEEAGINLKLKEDARSRWVGVTQIAGGASPLLCNASVFTMRIAPKIQNMFTLKADNTGWNPATEVTDHSFMDFSTSGDDTQLWPDYISADIISSPLAERRTRDNLSWIANAITSWTHGDATMRLNLNYIADRLDFNSRVTTDYLSHSIPDFVQRSELRTQEHGISAQFNTEINRRGYFLKDRLSLNADWESARSDISGSMALRQKIGRKRLEAANDLRLIKRTNRNILTLTSRTSLSHAPDRLGITENGAIMQRLTSTDLCNTTEFQRGWFFGYWKAYVNAGVELDYHRFRTSISGIEGYDGGSDCKAFVGSLRVGPQLDYDKGMWRLSFKSSFRLSRYAIRGQHDFAEIAPLLYVRRQLSAKSDVSASLNYNLTPPSPHMFIPTPVICDYRNIFIAATDGKRNHSTGATLAYRYRNPLKAFFANISASYSRSHSPMMGNQVFSGDYVISTFSELGAAADVMEISAGTSKGLGHGRMVIGADFSASRSSSTSMRDNVELPNKVMNISAKPYFKGSLLRWLSVNYEFSYRHSRFAIEKGLSSRNDAATQNLRVVLTPHDDWQFTIGGEHYHNRFSEGTTANLFLLDISAVWHISAPLRISLDARNLLDRREYRYMTYGTLSTSEYTCRIRPRNIIASLQIRF